MGSCLRHGKRCSATRVSDCLTGIDLCAPRARLRVSDSIWNSVEVSSPRWTVPKIRFALFLQYPCGYA